jgi:hypothetical protein
VADVDIHTGPAPPLNIPHCRESERESKKEEERNEGREEKLHVLFYVYVNLKKKKKKKKNQIPLSTLFPTFCFLLYSMAYMERRVIASDTIITVIKNTQENDASSDFFSRIYSSLLLLFFSIQFVIQCVRFKARTN